MIEEFDKHFEYIEKKAREAGMDAEMLENVRSICSYTWSKSKPQWQPIETAPKDGYILIYTPHPDSQMKYRIIDVAVISIGNQATHWQPLPPAP